jgi:hypothetical protein
MNPTSVIVAPFGRACATRANNALDRLAGGYQLGLNTECANSWQFVSCTTYFTLRL